MPEPITPEEIAEWTAACKAFPERWEATFKHDIEDYPPSVLERVGDKQTIGEHWDSEICQADYEHFKEIQAIALAHNALPRLIARVQWSRARITQLEHQAECYWYELAAGPWALDHCDECKRLHEAVETAQGE